MTKQERYHKLVESLRAALPQMTWSAATQPVPGKGSLDAKIMFVGEAPGAKEDEAGEPFVGAAGKLLSELLGSIGLAREDIYITNVVKFRPPENRDPTPMEVEQNAVYLAEELDLIAPEIIVLLGRHAMRWFFPALTISEVRGKARKKDDRLYFVTFHPAAALYNPNLKTTLIDDFKKLKVLLEDQTVQAPKPKPDDNNYQQDSLFN
jgi:uracil-DNA glycosylase family 4